MGVSEMRRHFAAYGSGELPEGQLRNMIRRALSAEPKLGEEFIALTDACRRANVIGERLQSSIHADILEITSPNFDLTQIRPPTSGPDWVESAAFDQEPAANTMVLDPADHPMGHSTAQSSPNSGGKWNFGDPQPVGTALQPGAVLRDRFVLVEELGRGGMGVVYKALDRRRGDLKDRHVAIKVLGEAFKRHPLAVKSLQREARKAQRLAHPNIVAVHDLDRDGGNVFMVMELLAGRSLDKVLREDGQGGIPLGPAFDIIRALAAALSYAHEHDIVHCDFKPGNAFLGEDGRVKVLDFGIARAAPVTEQGEPTLFDAGQLGAASPSYASLELLQGESPDVRDDVYSLACVAYELLSGVHPYQRIDAARALQMGLAPRPLRKLSRTQWRALKAGLALRRVERAPTIESLTRGLLAPAPRTGLWVAGGLCAAIAAVAGGVLVTRFHSKALPVAAHPAPTLAPASPVPIPMPAPTPVPSEQSHAAPPAAAVVESAAPKPASPPKAAASPAPENRHVGLEALKEQFESQAIAGDVEGALKSGVALVHAAPASAYAITEVPRITGLAYARRARTQFMAGQVDAALQTLAEGRRRYGRSLDLKDQEARYVAAADLYDRLRTAVVLNPDSMRQSLEQLKATQGPDFPAMEQMFARTLADRIADQRAAGRATVADALEKSGRALFPDEAQVLRSGQAGRLPAASLEIDGP